MPRPSTQRQSKKKGEETKKGSKKAPLLKLTKKRLAYLRHLNQVCKELEHATLAEIKDLEKLLLRKSLLDHGPDVSKILDIGVEFQFWWNEKFCQKHGLPNDDEDELCHVDMFGGFVLFDKGDNWNEWPSIKGEHICFSMHRLIETLSFFKPAFWEFDLIQVKLTIEVLAERWLSTPVKTD